MARRPSRATKAPGAQCMYSGDELAMLGEARRLIMTLQRMALIEAVKNAEAKDRTKGARGGKAAKREELDNAIVKIAMRFKWPLKISEQFAKRIQSHLDKKLGYMPKPGAIKGSVRRILSRSTG
jgi:hypothetical protein